MKKIFNSILEFFIIILQGIMIGVMFVFCKIKFRVKLNKNGIELPKEPAIFLCNHQSNWDPIFFRVLMPRRVYFLAHDELFKNKFTAWCAKHLIDTVKRGASKNDIGAIRQLLELKKQCRNIGIFPEGGISFWCESSKVPENMAKLCKKLKMPIVLHQLNGASFYYPRYNDFKAKVRPIINRMRVITAEEVEAMSVEELTRIINECLYVNDFEMQKKRMVNLRRKHPAEKVERGLFCCPHCNEFGTLSTKDNVMKCSKCGFYNIVNRYELLESPNPNFAYYEDFIAWDRFQIDYLGEYLAKYKEMDKPILSTYSGICKYGNETDSYSHIEEQDACLEVFKSHLLLTIGLDVYNIPYSDVIYAYVEFRDTLEIKMANTKLRLRHEEGVVWSPYHFAKTINALKQIHNNANKIIGNDNANNKDND